MPPATASLHPAIDIQLCRLPRRLHHHQHEGVTGVEQVQLPACDLLSCMDDSSRQHNVQLQHIAIVTLPLALALAVLLQLLWRLC